MSGRILVLDDEENYAEMLQDLLLQNNYRVDMVTRPERAIDRLEELRYDLVVSDYKMPVMDGADFLKRAREIYPDLPFILVSGLMNTPELVKVANMSVTLVLEKPLDTDLFLEHVRRFSEPMSEEEANSYQASGGGARPRADDDFPDIPSHYSARCDASNAFLAQAWRMANRHPFLIVLDGKGGDAELAARDLSVWKEERDREMVRMELSRALADDAPLVLEELVRDGSKSNVVFVDGGAFQASRDIEKISRLEEWTLPKVSGGDDLLLVFSLPRMVRNPEIDRKLGERFGEKVLVNPGLSSRLPDLANYVRNEIIRAGSPLGFSHDAVFALLSYPWPGNLYELRAIMNKLIAGGGDEPVSIERVARAMGQRSLNAVPPGDRLETLLRLCQADFFQAMAGSGESGADELKAIFGITANPEGSSEDFAGVSLVKPDLAKL